MSEIVVEGRAYNHVHVLVDGQVGSHSFTSIMITRHLNALGSTFEISFPNRWVDTQKKFLFIIGKRIRVILKERNVMLEGFIEKISTEVAKDSHLIWISGRDKTGDLVDCSPSKFPEFSNLTLAEIAGKVCSPFKIKVFDNAFDKFRFPTAKLRPAETVFSFLDRLSKQRGLLLNSVPIAGGGISLIKPGKISYQREVLDYGNILHCTTEVDISKVFSEYTVISQTNQVTNIDDDEGEIEQETNVVATVKDDTSRRKTGPGEYVERPMTFIAEKQSTAAQATSRAKWEQVRRLGEMIKINILVNGWLTRDGDIWRENRKVRVDYPHAGLDGVYLITTCKYMYGSDQSIKTMLTLTHKDAYTPSPTTVVKANPQENLNWDVTRESFARRARKNKLPITEVLEPRGDIPVTE